MDLLHVGTEGLVVTLWLGHESAATAQVFLDAYLELKHKVLDKTAPPSGEHGRYRPGDKLLAFMKGL